MIAAGITAFCISASALAQPETHAAIEVIAPEPLAKLLKANLDVPRAADTQVDANERLRMVRQATKQAQQLLDTEGYFTAQVKVEAGTTGNTLVVSVDPGRRTEVASVDIEFRGDVAQPGAERAARVKALREAWGLRVGMPFRQEDWARSKQSVLQDLLAQNYAAASLADSSAEIDPEQASAHLRIVYDSGPTFTLGKLELSGLDAYTAELVARYNTLQPGEPYSQGRLLELQNALQNTPYFASVAVDIDRDPGHAAGAPVLVSVREAKPKRVGLGIGISSDTGARAEVNYSYNNFLKRAWILSTGLRADQKRQFAYADVHLPPSAGDYRDSFGVLAERSDIQGLVTRRSAAAAVRTRHRGRIETQLSLKLEREDLEVAASPSTTVKALSLNYSWTYRDVDNLLDPRSGYVLNLQLGGASKALLSDQDFVRSYARYQHYFPVGDKDNVILRGELGHTVARSCKGIPQDFLFRTGGAQSVRGYDFQSLGVHENDAVVGARKLTAASAEYVHWFDPKWGGAAFYDIGNAWDSVDKARLFSGYGVGARWRSPAGPIALDLAYGHHEQQFRLHFAVAVPF